MSVDEVYDEWPTERIPIPVFSQLCIGKNRSFPTEHDEALKARYRRSHIFNNSKRRGHRGVIASARLLGSVKHQNVTGFHIAPNRTGYVYLPERITVWSISFEILGIFSAEN